MADKNAENWVFSTAHRSLWEQGISKTDNGIVIAAPDLRIDQIVNSSIPIFENTANGDNAKIMFGPFTIDGYQLVAAMWFKQGRPWFCMIELDDLDRSRLFGISDDGIVPLAFYEQWVATSLGKKSPAKFPWGKIIADKDHWTLCTSLLFFYETAK
jgi:hypothetical protein